MRAADPTEGMASTGAGYSGTPLPRKLGLKSGFRAAVMGGPDDYFALLGDPPPDIEWVELPCEDADFVHLFVRNRSELEHLFPEVKGAIARDGMLWVSWPKKSSGVATDITGNDVREVGLLHGLVDVKVCAVDHIWSGLKFVYRVADR